MKITITRLDKNRAPLCGESACECMTQDFQACASGKYITLAFLGDTETDALYRALSGHPEVSGVVVTKPNEERALSGNVLVPSFEDLAMYLKTHNITIERR